MRARGPALDITNAAPVLRLRNDAYCAAIAKQAAGRAVPWMNVTGVGIGSGKQYALGRAALNEAVSKAQAVDISGTCERDVEGQHLGAKA